MNTRWMHAIQRQAHPSTFSHVVVAFPTTSKVSAGHTLSFSVTSYAMLQEKRWSRGGENGKTE